MARGRVARFFAGGAYVVRALRLVGAERRLWAWIVAPALLSLLLSGAVLYVTYHYGSAFVAAHVAGHGTLVTALSWIFFWLALVGVAIAGYLATSAIATAPFSAYISEQTERVVTGAIVRAPTTLAASVRGLGYTIFLAVVYLASEGVLVVLEVVVEPLAPLWIALGLVCSALFLAYDHLDVPLSRRGMNATTKWAYVHDHLAEALGFGAAAALLACVPGFGLVVPAVATTGATLLCIEPEQAQK